MNNFKELRKEKGLTQLELAKILEIDQTTVSKWELGKAVPDTAMLIKLAEFFDVSTDYLLSRSNYYYPDTIEIANIEENNNKTQFAEKLKELRNEKGKSQKALAEAIGVGQSTIAQIELARNEATASTIRKLSAFFDVSADYLLGLTSDDGAELYSPPTAGTMHETLSPDERELVERYRALDDKLKKIVMDGIKVYGGANELVSKSGKKV